MADATRILIQGPGGAGEVIQGEIQYIPQEDPQKIKQTLEQEGSPFSDYFLFQGEKKGVYVVQADATHFSLLGKQLKDYKIQLPFQEELSETDPEGAPVLSREITLKEVIDNEGMVQIENCEVKLDSKNPLPHEQFLAGRLKDYFLGVIKEKKEEGFDQPEIAQAIQKIRFLTDSLAGQVSLNLEKIHDSKKYRLKIAVRGAPLGIHFDGLPVNIVDEAGHFLGPRMAAHLKRHPLVVEFNRGAMNDSFQDDSLEDPVLDHSLNHLSWHYPDRAPTQTEFTSIGRGLTELTTDVDPFLAPRLLPYELMPIPQSLFQEFQLWLTTRLEREVGKYEINVQPEAKDGFWRFQVIEKPFSQIRIFAKDVEELQKIGIDLNEEKKELDRGTGDWSQRQWNHFIERLQKKYRDAGFEFLHDHPESAVSYDQGKIYWLQVKQLLPLLPVENIHLVVADSDLKGLPDKASLEKAFFQQKKKINRQELQEGAIRLGETFRKSDFLLASSYPDNKESGTVPVQLHNEEAHLSLRIARCGQFSLRAKDGLQKSSLEAFRKGIQWKRGEPFRPKEFEKKLIRILQRLDLQLDGEIEYFYEDGVHLNVTIPLKAPQAAAMVGAGIDIVSGTPLVQGSLSVPHRVPGTSRSSIQLVLGGATQGVSASATSLPITEGGTRVVGGISADRQSYSHSDASTLSIGPYATFLIPLGKEGIASPWQLHLPFRARHILEKGPDGSESHTFLGTGAGLSYLDGSLLTKNDLLSLYLGQDIDVEKDGETADTTTKGKIGYRHPVNLWGMYWEWQANLFHRETLIGEKPSIYRMYQGMDRPIDFSAGMDRAPYRTNAHLGGFIKKPLGPVTLVAGATWTGSNELTFSGDPAGWHQRMGVGVGVELNFLGGATLTVGWPIMEDGKFHTPDPVPRVGFTITIPLDF
ncbi:MAG: hypothetical protein HYT77_07150 [Deltaproteobacteria bacterium]|nr:hypothetical protein [Deltaproteobacteria bacterium]